MFMLLMNWLLQGGALLACNSDGERGCLGSYVGNLV
jgi:hypothetical protein